jgi:hypothetical protein
VCEAESGRSDEAEAWVTFWRVDEGGGWAMGMRESVGGMADVLLLWYGERLLLRVEEKQHPLWR